jgi:hypothetical protein
VIRCILDWLDATWEVEFVAVPRAGDLIDIHSLPEWESAIFRVEYVEWSDKDPLPFLSLVADREELWDERQDLLPSNSAVTPSDETAREG